MNFEQQNYLVKLLKSMSNANRLKLLRLIAQTSDKKNNVNSIVDRSGMSQSAVSNYLAKLRSDGLVKAEQVGKNMIYSINDANVLKILQLTK